MIAATHPPQILKWSHMQCNVNERLQCKGSDPRIAFKKIPHVMYCTHSTSTFHRVLKEKKKGEIPKKRWMRTSGHICFWKTRVERKLGMPSGKKSAVFFNIVQKAFDPPLLFEHLSYFAGGVFWTRFWAFDIMYLFYPQISPSMPQKSLFMQISCC